MASYFLTIDNGGTNTKAIIIDLSGKQISVSSFPTVRIEDRPGFHEINMNVLWQSICKAIQKAISDKRINPRDIIGVSTVGHGKGLYVLDKNHQVFTHGILSTDTRATKLAEHFEAHLNDIFSISHQHIMPSQSPVILRWLKNNKPELYKQIGTVLAAKDFVRFRLTGSLNQEYGDASGNNLMNLNNQHYDKKLLNFFGIDEIINKLPPLKHFNELCGNVTSKAATETGLVEGTPVFAGLFDIDACAIATGVLDDSLFSVTAGTWNINVFPSNEMALQPSNLMNSIFPNGKFLLEASSATSAGNLAMTIEMLMSEETKNAKDNGHSIYDVLEDFLRHTDASFSHVIFFPFLYGSNVDPDAEGAYIGIQSISSKSSLMRAVYEGIVFAHRHHIEQLINELGHKPCAIRLSGGGTNSPAWIQMFADIFNLPVETIDNSELGGLGGAIASSLGTGVYSSLQEAVKKMSIVNRRFEPNLQQTKIYEQKYKIYCYLLEKLDGSWTKLKNMQERISS